MECPEVGHVVVGVVALLQDGEVYNNGFGGLLGQQGVHGAHVEGEDGVEEVHAEIAVVEGGIELVVAGVLGEEDVLLLRPLPQVGVHVAIPH